MGVITRLRLQECSYSTWSLQKPEERQLWPGLRALCWGRSPARLATGEGQVTGWEQKQGSGRAGEGGFGSAPQPAPSHPVPVTNTESGKFGGSLRCPVCLCQGRSCLGAELKTPVQGRCAGQSPAPLDGEPPGTLTGRPPTPRGTRGPCGTLTPSQRSECPLPGHGRRAGSGRTRPGTPHASSHCRP